MDKRVRFRTLRVGVWIACVGLLAAACGSSATSAGTSGGSGGSGSGSAASISSQGVAQATALVGKYLGDPAFVAPGPSINVAALKGKSILSVPANSLVPFVATVDGVMKGYAQDLGMKYTIYTNQQQLGQWVQGMNQAISTKASAIDLLSGIPPDLLKAQVQQAQAAGIPTVDTNERDPSQPTVPYVAAYAFAPFNLAGQLMSAWAVEQTKGKADVLVVTSNEDTSSAAVQAGITQELRTVCGGCKESAVNVNPEDWAKSLQTTVEGKLSADPNINYILPVFDSMAQYIAPGIIAAGKSGKVHVASFNGTPSILDMIRSGDIVTMDVGENTSDVAAAGLDQIMRIMLHQPVGKEQINVRVLDKSNVADAGVPAVSGKGYGDAFMTGYATTWGVSPSLLGG